MKDYVAYRAESEVEGSPVVQRRKRSSQSTPQKRKKPSKAKAGSSSQRKGKQIVQESDSEETKTDSDSDATDIDSETGERVIKMPGGPVRLEKAKKVVHEEDEEFNPEITKSKKVKAA